MARGAMSPYHLGPQQAQALLAPIEQQLGDLEARLTQYVERIPMEESDRAVIARALEVIRDSHLRLGQIVSEDRPGR